MIPRCWAVNLGCMARYSDEYAKLYQIFGARGIDMRIAAAAHHAVGDTLLSSSRLVAKVKHLSRSKRLLNEGSIGDDFAKWLKESFALYPDVDRAFRTWRALDVPVAIIAKGDSHTQRQKIGLLGTMHTDVRYVVPPSHVSEALRNLVQRYGKPVFFGSYRVRELEEIRADGLCENTVRTFYVRRPDKVHYDGPPKFRHTEVQSFSELGFLEKQNPILGDTTLPVALI